MIRGTDNLKNWLLASGHTCWKLFSDPGEKSLVSKYWEENSTNEAAINTLLSSLEIQEPGRFYVRTSPGPGNEQNKSHQSTMFEIQGQSAGNGNNAQALVGNISQIIAEKVELQMTVHKMGEQTRLISRLRKRIISLKSELEEIQKQVEEPSEFEQRIARVLGIVEPQLPALMGIGPLPAVGGPAPSGSLQERLETSASKLGKVLGEERFVKTLERLALLPDSQLTGLVSMLEGSQQ